MIWCGCLGQHSGAKAWIAANAPAAFRRQAMQHGSLSKRAKPVWQHLLVPRMGVQLPSMSKGSPLAGHMRYLR